MTAEYQTEQALRELGEPDPRAKINWIKGSIAVAWREDFRPDLARITIPVLVVQGDQDRIMPPEATGDRLPGLIRNARHVVIREGPYAIIWTHASQVNQALLSFIRAL